MQYSIVKKHLTSSYGESFKFVFYLLKSWRIFFKCIFEKFVKNIKVKYFFVWNIFFLNCDLKIQGILKFLTKRLSFQYSRQMFKKFHRSPVKLWVGRYAHTHSYYIPYIYLLFWSNIVLQSCIVNQCILIYIHEILIYPLITHFRPRYKCSKVQVSNSFCMGFRVVLLSI